MKSNNTLLYLGIGAGLLYFLSKSKAVVKPVGTPLNSGAGPKSTISQTASSIAAANSLLQQLLGNKTPSGGKSPSVSAGGGGGGGGGSKSTTKPNTQADTTSSTGLDQSNPDVAPSTDTGGSSLSDADVQTINDAYLNGEISQSDYDNVMQYNLDNGFVTQDQYNSAYDQVQSYSDSSTGFNDTQTPDLSSVDSSSVDQSSIDTSSMDSVDTSGDEFSGFGRYGDDTSTLISSGSTILSDLTGADVSQYATEAQTAYQDYNRLTQTVTPANKPAVASNAPASGLMIIGAALLGIVLLSSIKK